MNYDHLLPENNPRDDAEESRAASEDGDRRCTCCAVYRHMRKEFDVGGLFRNNFGLRRK